MNEHDQIARMNELDKLAKLLATEDLLIEHKNVPTASFDTENRILTLPMWKNISKTLYHMLIEHEIGHALYTPSKEWIQTVKENVGIRDILNVIEDARIERMIKDKYPGTRRDFREGYKHMFDSDFFKIKNRRMSSFPLIDRINLYYKLGDHIKIPFTHKEKLIIGEIDKIVTFEDAIALAKRLAKLITEIETNYSQPDNENAEHTLDSTLTVSNVETDDSNNTTELDSNEVTYSKSDSIDGDVIDSSESDESINQSPIINSETIKALENAMNTIIDRDNTPNTYYRAESSKNWQAHIIDYTTILAEVRNHKELPAEIIVFNKLRNSSNRVVDYLLKEFQIRKAADQYVRAREAKTGVINPARLHSYRMTDDIFRRVSISPDSKNHGIMMFIDFSGSMRYNMKSTVEQLINLVLFCRKANIPHRVYGFSDVIVASPIYEKSRYNNTLVPSPSLSIIELYHESMKLNDFRDMSATLLSQFNIKSPIGACATSRTYCKYFSLGSTPLDCTILIARSMLKMFKKQTNAQIISAVFLTDGDSTGTYVANSTYHKSAYDQETEIINSTCRRLYIRGGHNVIYDPIHRKYYANKYYANNSGQFDFVGPRSSESSQFVTNTLLKILKSDGYHTIGFQIDKKSKIKTKIDTLLSFLSTDYKKIESFQREFRKNGCATLVNVCGYDELHLIHNLDVSDDEDDEYSFKTEENATNAQIKRAFIESRTDRINSRIILNNFAKRIST